MHYIRILFLLTIFLFTFMLQGNNAFAAENDDNVIICIDPGHGGENTGAEWDGYTEKEMTLITACAMKEELEKYDGIEVFMTRTEDVDMELEERIDYAVSVNADYFFCIHYNMSENHDLYGAECWISAFGENYAKGMDFAGIEMDVLTDLGLYDRGIKTRLNSKGTNYYGILRLGDQADLPAVIIEHCHVDNANDADFYISDEKLQNFGRLDADAVAKYYHLKSDELGKDYTGFEYASTEVPDECMAPDETEPELLSVTYGDFVLPGDPDGEPLLPITVSAEDDDNRMLYTSVSTDGGSTWSSYYPWYESREDEYSDTSHISVPVEYDTDIRLKVRVFNLYGLYTESELMNVSGVSSQAAVETTEDTGVQQSADAGYEDYTDISPYDDSDDTVKEGISDRALTVIVIVICILIVFCIVMMLRAVMELKLRNRRRNDTKNDRMSHRDHEDFM